MCLEIFQELPWPDYQIMNIVLSLSHTKRTYLCMSNLAFVSQPMSRLCLQATVAYVGHLHKKLQSCKTGFMFFFI